MNAKRLCLLFGSFSFALVAALNWSQSESLAQALEKRGDVREFTIGMSADSLPEEGYLGFTCADEVKPGEMTLAGWHEYKKCPANADGNFEVSFQYDDDGIGYDKFEGTKIGGQPVYIALVITPDGVVDGIRSVTNPNVFYRDARGAHILGLRVMKRYAGDWQCQDLPPVDGQEEVGGVFFKQRCELTKGDRFLLVHRDLYRLPGQTIKESFNQSRFEIWRAPTS